MPDEFPTNYESKVKPQFNDLKQALDEAKTWQAEFQTLSATRRRELARAK
jgi:hypothetical protein